MERVVKQNRQNRDVLTHSGFKVHAGKTDGRVTPYVDAQLLWSRQLRAHRKARP